VRGCRLPTRTLDTAQELIEHREPLVEHRGAGFGVRLVAERAEVRNRRLSETHPERHPAGTQMVQGEQVLGHDVHATARERRYESAQPDPLGRLGDGAEQYPRVVDIRLDLRGP